MIEKVQMGIRMEGIKGDQTLMLLDPLEMELLPYNATSVGDGVTNLQCVLLHLNYQGGGEGSKTGTNIPSPPQSTCEQRAEQPKPRNKPKAKPTVRTIHDRYH